MSVYEKINEVKGVLMEEIKERDSFGYAMPQSKEKRAYKHALKLIGDIEKEYSNEFVARKKSKNIKLSFNFDCLEREFKIEICDIFADIATKIIEEAYSCWTDNPNEILGDICCEEYIKKRLKDFGLEFKIIECKQK